MGGCGGAEQNRKDIETTRNIDSGIRSDRVKQVDNVLFV